MEIKNVNKVLAYITRKRNDKIELLVHEHRDFKEAGTQVPAGTVEKDEKTYEAILREIYEESGIKDLYFDKYITTYIYYSPFKNENHIRSVFSFQEHENNLLADRWEHIVKSDGEDDGLVFRYYWIPLEKHIDLAANQGDYLFELSRIEDE